jgi:hypothetical protein
MKTIIEINETNIASIQFEKDGKELKWEELSRSDQIKTANAMHAYLELFARFIPED